MAKYMVESPHTKEECLQALDDMTEREPELLDQTWFSCGAGEHKSYTTVEASNPSEAKEILPEFLRDKAHVVEVDKFTREKVESLHRM